MAVITRAMERQLAVMKSCISKMFIADGVLVDDEFCEAVDIMATELVYGLYEKNYTATEIQMSITLLKQAVDEELD